MFNENYNCFCKFITPLSSRVYDGKYYDVSLLVAVIVGGFLQIWPYNKFYCYVPYKGYTHTMNVFPSELMYIDNKAR